MSAVFFDASGWIALYSRKDVFHDQASTLYTEILKEGWPVLTTNWTLYEALTVLQSRVNYESALVCWSAATEIGEIIYADPFEAEALELFHERGIQGNLWSVVDCANFVVIKNRQCPLALSFDRDFAQAESDFGFKVLK